MVLVALVIVRELLYIEREIKNEVLLLSLEIWLELVGARSDIELLLLLLLLKFSINSVPLVWEDEGPVLLLLVESMVEIGRKEDSVLMVLRLFNSLLESNDKLLSLDISLVDEGSSLLLDCSVEDDDELLLVLVLAPLWLLVLILGASLKATVMFTNGKQPAKLKHDPPAAL